ncbi:MAG: AEC family transporter [Firmicutes bacterium]|nr:AEC family transporter [Bacillota bacterium]MBQ9016551.1 AEC family transporter [Bacillota bacterium]
MQSLATIDIIAALAKTFIIILPGYIVTKLGILDSRHTAGMSSLITCVTYPCLVISAMQMEFSMQVLNNCKYVVLIFLGAVVCALITSKIVSAIVKLPPERAGIFAFMLVFGNTGFIGLPVLNGLLGSEAVFYGALCDSSYDIFMFTIGIALIRNGASEDELSFGQTLKGLINPCMIGVLIGLTLYICGITLPDIIAVPVERIGGITSPLAMIVVGSHLARARMRDLFTCGHAYLVCLMKLIAFPLIALAIVKLTIGTGTLLAQVCVLQAAMPVAMLSVILSERYRGDVRFASAGVMMTTLMCIITIPLHAILLQHI